MNGVRDRRTWAGQVELGRWLGEVGLIGLAALLGCLFLLDSVGADQDAQSPPLVVDLGVAVAATGALLLLRRRWPVALALALIPTIAVSSAAMGATAVAMYPLARYRSGRAVAVVVGLHASTVGFLFAVASQDAGEYWQGLIVVLSLDAAFVATGRLVRSQELLVLSLRDRAVEAEERQRLRIDEARYAERERIAREMHDVLAHRVSLLAVYAGALEVRRSAPDEERRAAGVVRQCAYEALEDLRAAITMLRADPRAVDGAGDATVDADGADRPQPTLGDLPALVEQSRLAGAAITFDDLVGDLAVPDGAGRHVYRIVQEGLTNARKHAPGAPVLVRLTAASPARDGLTIEITNPVPAPGARSAIPGTGSGLIGLRERMDLVGGRLEHGRTPDGGFRLAASLPLRP